MRLTGVVAATASVAGCPLGGGKPKRPRSNRKQRRATGLSLKQSTTSSGLEDHVFLFNSGLFLSERIANFYEWPEISEIEG